MSSKKVSKNSFYSPGKYCKSTQSSVDYTFQHDESMTTPMEGDIYRTPSKQVLVTRDPVYAHPAIVEGHFIGLQPHSYLPLSIFVTIINPILGLVAILFATMSNRSYRQGDLKYAYKWSNHAFLMCMITIVVSLVLYVALFFSLSPIGIRGGHSY